MGTSIGAQGQLALVKETTYGTPVTPTRFLPFTSESFTAGRAFAITKAMRADAPYVRTASQTQPDKKDAGGSFTVEVNNKGFGMPLRAVMGTVVTTQPAVGTDPTVYDHTFTLGSTTPEIYTAETGWADLSANPFSKTLVSAMFEKMMLSVKVGELASATFDLAAKDMTVATAKTTPSYIAGLVPFTWSSSSFTLGGVSPDSGTCDIAVNRNLDKDRYYLGGGGTRKQPVGPTADVTADLSADFQDWTAYNRVLANTFTSLILTLTGATISNAYTFELKATLNVQTQGEPPTLSGPGRIAEPLKLVAYDDGSGPGSALTIRYRTTDSTP